MTVVVNTIDDVVGIITLRDGQFILTPPDSAMLKEIVRDPIHDGKGPVQPADGERFMRGLRTQYRSPYLWCSKAE